MLGRVNMFLAVLLATIVALAATFRVDYSRPNFEILPDMKYTPAWEAYAANPHFPNGQTLQVPVPGTIARGLLPLHYAATEEDAIRAGEELENPWSLSALAAAATATSGPPAETTPRSDQAGSELSASQDSSPETLAGEQYSASVERGGAVYRTFCISCHGVQGAGDGLVTQRGFPPPPSMLTGKSVQMKDGQLFHILTYGQGSMAPFAAQLSRERRWDVINFVRDLQRKSPPPPDPNASKASSLEEPAAPPDPLAVPPPQAPDDAAGPQTIVPPNELRERPADPRPRSPAEPQSPQKEARNDR